MLVIFTHEITVESPRAGPGPQGLTDFVGVELTVTACGIVRNEPMYDTPFGPLNFVTTVYDLEITSCVNETGTEVFAKLEADDAYQIMKAAEDHLVKEYERDFAGAE